MNNISVLVAEDHTIVRQGLRSILDKEFNIEVSGEAKDGKDVVDKVGRLNPDVVLMDISMPVLNGIDATRQIKKDNPDVKVIILSMHSSEEYIFQSFKAGASGYLIKQTADTELISAIQMVHKGDYFLNSSISRTLVQEYLNKTDSVKSEDSLQNLTGREREILQLIAEGCSNRKISEHLFISVKTVETHKANLMDKLNIHSIAELTKYALRKGIISLD